MIEYGGRAGNKSVCLIFNIKLEILPLPVWAASHVMVNRKLKGSFPSVHEMIVKRFILRWVKSSIRCF